MQDIYVKAAPSPIHGVGVFAVSPIPAAGLPPIITVGLPVMMVARLVGGTENGPPCGM